MSTPDRHKPASRPALPKQVRPSLAGAMGRLPLPPKIGKPPALRVSKPATASPARPAASAPRSSQANKPASGVAGLVSVAGRLGTFAAHPLESAQPPKGIGKKRKSR